MFNKYITDFNFFNTYPKCIVFYILKKLRIVVSYSYRIISDTRYQIRASLAPLHDERFSIAIWNSQSNESYKSAIKIITTNNLTDFSNEGDLEREITSIKFTLLSGKALQRDGSACTMVYSPVLAGQRLLYHNFTKYELYKRAITFMINESRKQNNRSLKQVMNDQVVMKVRYLS